MFLSTVFLLFFLKTRSNVHFIGIGNTREETVLIGAVSVVARQNILLKNLTLMERFGHSGACQIKGCYPSSALLDKQKAALGLHAAVLPDIMSMHMR